MKVLLINSIAEKISTGHIMFELYSYLKDNNHSVSFCYGRGEKIENPDFLRIDIPLEVYFHIGLSRVTSLQGYYSNHATSKLIRHIINFGPDVVVLGNIHGYYVNAFRLLKYLKEKNILTIYYMFDEHACLGKCCFIGNCEKYKTECYACPKRKGYPKSLFFDTSKKIFNQKLEVYKNFRSIRFVGVPYTVSRSRDSALFKKSNAIVYPFGWGINTRAEFIPKDSRDLRESLGIPKENKVVLAVAPYSNSRKGIKDYYYPIAKELKNLPISFVHVGFDGGPDADHENVITVPFVKEQAELAQYFSMADLFVIPSKSEGYPTVCLDSLSCGTPICGFNISGTPYVASEPYGTFVEPFNINELKEVIKRAPIKDKDIINSCRKYAQDNLDSNVMFGKLFEQVQSDLLQLKA